jgi:hypothetical protein
VSAQKPAPSRDAHRDINRALANRCHPNRTRLFLLLEPGFDLAGSDRPFQRGVVLFVQVRLGNRKRRERMIEGVSFGVYQELTEKTQFLFNFISVLSVVSC